MPISEDEYDPCSSYEASSTMSKAELRKTHKPIMEKRRRARINHCLNEIKTLILDAMKKDPARHSKLEKADILEMAVKHLQNVQRQQLALAMATDPSVLRKFKAGFNECAEEVKRYIGSLDGLDVGVQQRISSHLSKCISGIEQIVHLNFPGFGGVPFLTNTSNFFTSPNLHNESSSEAPGDQNNNPSIQISQSLQLIPSRLPTGEIALLLPNSTNLPYFSSITSPNHNRSGQSNNEPQKQPSRQSAFVTVIPSSALPPLKSPTKSKLLSPPQSPTSSSCNNYHDAAPDPPSIQTITRPSSPQGFRPVNPSQPHHLYINPPGYQQPPTKMEPQALVTSTSAERDFQSAQSVPSPKRPLIQTEVKNIRFPIQKFASPQKIAEPLSIITNHSERYKHAQILEETAHYEENAHRGVKRKNEFGLLTVAPKVLKTCHESSVADFRVVRGGELTPRDGREVSGGFLGVSRDDQLGTPQNPFHNEPLGPSTSRSREEPPEANSDMWRPW